jgi:hypothetical protein
LVGKEDGSNSVQGQVVAVVSARDAVVEAAFRVAVRTAV